MNMYWDRLLDIVDKTKEKIFFFSANRTYVVMSLDQYELLISKKSTNQDELVDRINEDIANLKAKMSVENELNLVRNIQSKPADMNEDDIHISALPMDESDYAESSNDDAVEDNEFHIEPVNIR